MITINVGQMDRAEAALQHIPKAAPKAIAKALNRAAETARTEAARKIREKYYVKHSDVISTIRIHRAKPEDLAAVVTSKGSPIALYKFHVTPKQPQPRRKTPIIVRVKRDSGGPLKRAFVARVGSALGVYSRVGKPRLPIRQHYGPSIPQMLDSEDVVQWVEDKARERLDERLDHEINRLLEGQ